MALLEASSASRPSQCVILGMDYGNGGLFGDSPHRCESEEKDRQIADGTLDLEDAVAGDAMRVSNEMNPSDRSISLSLSLA